jgi:hypothetical protein
MKIFFFVEGDTDVYFVERLLIPHISELESNCFTYANKPKKYQYIRGLIDNITHLADNYVYIRDGDHENPNIIELKRELIQCVGNLSEENIVVSVFEIESWFLAGLDVIAQAELHLTNDFLNNTHRVTKEKFRSIAQKNNMDDVTLQEYCAQNFELALARQRSTSFDSLVSTLDLLQEG